jgi:hypothetical protein
MDISIFMNKEIIPDNEKLKLAIDSGFGYWSSLVEFATEKYPNAVQEWNYSGQKYGWSFKLKDKKRTIIYFLPRDGYFKVAFVFGQKAANQIFNSDISAEIKAELESAQVYAEGRGIRIDIVDESKLNDIKKLIEIKLAN